MPTFGRSLLSGALVLAACAACVARTGGHAARRSAEGFVALPDGGRLYYEAKGSGPAVVLIHGGQLDRRMWDGQFDTLARAHRVIRYDVRGFGRSPPGPGADFRSYEDLGALLDSLGVARTSIVGLSLGGRIAVDFALAHPARVERLVLLAPGLSGFPWSQQDSAWSAAMERAVRARDTVAVTDLWLRSSYMAPAMENPALAPRLRELSLANSGAFLRARMGRELEPPSFGRLRELRAPVLVAVGTRDDPDIRTIVDSIAAQAPRARKLVLPGAGHMLNMERPAEVTRAVIDFLGERE
jgi:pimeloyl-ACP methyl ester carboxylesterase